MKNWMRFIALAVFAAPAAHAQDIAGDWMGTLKSGPAELRLSIHITRTAAGAFTGTLDSIDQGVNGIPITSITLNESKLTFQVTAFNGSYEGKVSGDGNEIEGNWTQVQGRIMRQSPCEYRQNGWSRGLIDANARLDTGKVGI